MSKFKLDDESLLIVGTAGRDAEVRRVGDRSIPRCLFSLAVGKNVDTTTEWINCIAWRNLAIAAGDIQKGNTVMAIGKMEDHEYNGQIYSNLVLEYLSIVGNKTKPVSRSSAGNGVPVQDTDGNRYSDLNGNDELPF